MSRIINVQTTTWRWTAWLCAVWMWVTGWRRIEIERSRERPGYTVYGHGPVDG